VPANLGLATHAFDVFSGAPVRVQYG
jgi:hypothetical protein